MENLTMKQLRGMRGYSQEEMANKLGISKRTYSDYELQKRMPSLTVALKFSKIVNWDIWHIIFANDVAKSAT